MAQRNGRLSSSLESRPRSEYWRGQHEAWLRSGLTQVAFCEEHDRHGRHARPGAGLTTDMAGTPDRERRPGAGQTTDMAGTPDREPATSAIAATAEERATFDT